MVDNKKEFSPQEVYHELCKAAIAKIDQVKLQLQNLEKAEDFIVNGPNSNNPQKRIKSINGKGSIVPGDKKSKKIKAEGSGGEIKKDEMISVTKSGPTGPESKPIGVPSAGKPPQAPGAAPTMHKTADTHKMELPHTSEKANGGNMSTKKMELPHFTEKANGGTISTKKAEMPHSTEKANGGQISNESMAKAVSPVFGVLARPRMGGKDPVSQQMTMHASQAAQANTAVPNVNVKPTIMPSQQDHTSRAVEFAQHSSPSQYTGHKVVAPPKQLPNNVKPSTPVPSDAYQSFGGHKVKGAKAGIDLPTDTGGAMEIERFGKAELDSVKCPKCKQGMTLCKCMSKYAMEMASKNK